MIEDQKQALTELLTRALSACGLSPEPIRLERPKQAGHGDLATTIALQCAKKAGKNPRELAAALVEAIKQDAAFSDILSDVEIAGPGFINFRFSQEAKVRAVRDVLRQGSAYGTSKAFEGKSVLLEYVSANPTGPIHLGGTRWAAVGDALGRVLAAQGAEVTREYYFNDAGAQIDRFVRSLIAAAKGEQAPEDGYGGDYIAEIAQQVLTAEPDALDQPVDARHETFRRIGVGLMFEQIKQSLHEFGTDFDVFFHEDSLHSSGAVQRSVEQLKETGHLYPADGAWWLRSTEFGDDKDRVLLKSDGAPAYIAGDVAYLRDKRNRGFDLCIYMLGADHHGYIARLKAAAAAFGDDPDVVEVLIGQLVNLVRDGKPVRMSKRAGTVVTMEDLVDAVGVDAARYSLIRSSVDTAVDIDLDLISKRTNENPVFYVQYAHARLSSLQRNAASLGIDRGSVTDADLSLLTHEREGDLIRTLGEFPRVTRTAAELREPHRVARYLEDVASAYHKFYDACRVLQPGDDQASPLTIARLHLCEATRRVLANGLALLGVSAPEQM